MKVAITGQGEITNEEIQEMLDHYDLKPKTVLSASETPLEKAFEEWASSNNLEVEVRKAEWGNLDVEKCTPRDGKYGQYNARAAFNRNDEMVDDADAVIHMHDHSRSSGGIVEYAGKTDTKVYSWPLMEEDNVPF